MVFFFRYVCVNVIWLRKYASAQIRLFNKYYFKYRSYQEHNDRLNYVQLERVTDLLNLNYYLKRFEKVEWE